MRWNTKYLYDNNNSIYNHPYIGVSFIIFLHSLPVGVLNKVWTMVVYYLVL